MDSKKHYALPPLERFDLKEILLLIEQEKYFVLLAPRQTGAYMDRCGAKEGHLVVFDRSENKTWDQKIFQREEQVEGKNVIVRGM